MSELLVQPRIRLSELPPLIPAGAGAPRAARYRRESCVHGSVQKWRLIGSSPTNRTIAMFGHNAFSHVYPFLEDMDLYQLARYNPILGVGNILRLIEFCREHETEIGWDDYSGDEDIYALRRLFDFNLPEHVPVLATQYKLKYFSDEVKQDRKFVLMFIRHNPFNLRFAHVKFLDDREVILLVVQKYGLVVKDVSEHLADDDEVVELAMKNNFIAIRYASERIQQKHAEVYARACERMKRLFEVPRLLKRDYFLNEALTGAKYVRWRTEHHEHLALQKDIALQREQQEQELREQELQEDKEYRRRRRLPPDTKLYRNNYGEYCSHTEYLDEYYADNAGRHCPGYY
jgi:hypothetical protein